MKSFFRAAAATGLAAATIAGSVGLHAASAHAASSSPIGAIGATFPLISQYNQSSQRSAMTRTRWGTAVESFSSAAAAESNALPLTAVRGPNRDDGTPQWMLGLDTPDAKGNFACLGELTMDSGVKFLGSHGTTCNAETTVAAARLFAYVDGQWQAGTGRFVTGARYSGTMNQNLWTGFVMSGSSSASYHWTPDASPFGLLAVVRDQNPEKGTALLVGEAILSADKVRISWGGRPDRYQAVDAETGGWSYQLSDLPLGSTPVHLEALAGSEVVAERDIDVTLAVTELSATVTLSSDRAENAVLSGEGEPNAVVEATFRDVVVGMRTIVDEDKHWSIEVPAPNRGGDYELTVTQKIRGMSAGEPRSATIPYGQGVNLSDPLDGAEVDPEDPTIAFQGSGEKGAPLTLFEKGNREQVLGTGTVNPNNGSFLFFNDVPLEDREYVLLVEQLGKGNNTTTAEVTINPGKSTVEEPTADVRFDTDVTKKAVVSGAGADGATITVKDGTKELGSTTVTDGKWSLPIDPIGPGAHTLTVEQTGIQGTQTTTTEADYGDAVAITSQTDGKVAAGIAEISGTTQVGAKVQVTVGGKSVDATVDGTNWTAKVEVAPADGPVEITATQQSKGALTTTDSKQVTTDGDQQHVDVAFTDPADGYYLAPPVWTRVAGTANAFADVTVRAPWGEIGSTTADANGNWELWAGFGPTAIYELTATQNRTDGTTSQSAVLTLAPQASSEHKPVVIDTPDGFYTPGETTKIEGTATPLASVEITAPWGSLGTVSANAEGRWAYYGQFGPSATYQLTATQTRVDDGSTSDSNTITLKPKGDQTSPVVIDTPDGTYQPGEATLVSGTASPGAQVAINATWGLLDTVQADENGAWQYYGFFGPTATYELTAVQTRTDQSTTTSNTITLTPAGYVDPNAPVTITTTSGTYDPKGVTKIEGTSAPDAAIVIDAAWGRLGSTKANAMGHWEYYGYFGPTATYELTANQTRLDGTTSTSNTITLTPATQ